MTPEDRAALEVTIVAACTAHETAHWQDYNNYQANISIGTTYFVKFDGPQSLEPQVATQTYISAYAEAHPELPGTPRIPKVLFSFQHKWTMHMVMEYIQLADSPPDFEKRADALIWLSKVPLPPNHILGPLGRSHSSPILQILRGASTFLQRRGPRAVHRESVFVFSIIHL